MNQKRLIELAERAKGVDGSEKWPLRLYRTDYTDVGFFDPEEDGVLSRVPGFTIYGPLLPHNPLDPMNPAACLRRAGVRLLDTRLTLSINWSHITLKRAQIQPHDYTDYMEALLNLHDLAKLEGGTWAKAWERAMNPEVGE